MSDGVDERKDGSNNGMNAKQSRARGRRNLSLALMIVGFVILIYVVTILRLGGSVAERAF